MRYTCTVCQAQFDDSSAYCEDWRDPTRRFACPRCHTFYVKRVSAKTPLKPLLAVMLVYLSIAIVLLYYFSGEFAPLSVLLLLGAGLVPVLVSYYFNQANAVLLQQVAPNKQEDINR
ncbi:hypothetical protein LMJ53_09110 [Rheinheimera sp. UJ51]|uniref:hypothetical protein n=1 Tax=Rheinheimera sp. UJ51 TaxID=2892446 RepID=UPI001E3AEA4E|nr:hypothetical protein [Rheinheimera sp. UJ51]MCC5451881.1 hypothetical protein [Rheinheimera sp. UJ51]